MIDDEPPEFAVVDLKLPDQSGLKVVAHLKAADAHTRIVVLTGHASIPTAVEAIKLGATYYLTKPTDADAVVAAFGRDGGDDSVPIDPRPMTVERVEWEHIQHVLHEQRRQRLGHRARAVDASADAAAQAAPASGVASPPAGEQAALARRSVSARPAAPRAVRPPARQPLVASRFISGHFLPWQAGLEQKLPPSLPHLIGPWHIVHELSIFDRWSCIQLGALWLVRRRQAGCDGRRDRLQRAVYGDLR